MPSFFDGESVETDEFIFGNGDESPCFGCLEDCSKCPLYKEVKN